jgi:hypothetical protein
MSNNSVALPKRPFGVTLIAGIQAVNALALGIQFALSTEDPSTLYKVPGDPGFAAVLFVMLGLTTAVGLWLLKRWAWVTTMLWAGFAMFSSVVAYVRGDPTSYLTMALALVQVFYLNLTDVQKVFEKNDRPEAALG